MDNKTYLILGTSVLGAAGAGFFGGYRWAMKKYYRSYEEVISQEIKEAKEFYANLYKQDYPTPADAAEALIPDVKLEEATIALRKYANVTVKPEDLIDQGSILQYEKSPQEAVEESIEVEVVERNIFDNGDQLAIHKEERDTSKPYVVDYDEYMEHPDGHEEVQLTYYAGDGVLGDDNDEPIEDVEGIVGRMNLNMFGASDPEDPHILLIRNEQKKLDIEVTHSDGKFAHEVLGFNHSDEPERRIKRRWDDE
jgi:hypothetical protein